MRATIMIIITIIITIMKEKVIFKLSTTFRVYSRLVDLLIALSLEEQTTLTFG